MSIRKCNVYFDGDSYIANIPTYHASRVGIKRRIDDKFKKFKEYYCEAVNKKISRNSILDYVKDRFWDTANDVIDDVITDEEAEDYYERHVSNIHKRIKRLKRKAYLGTWNWFITLTYDSEKMSVEEFEEKVERTLSNFSTRRKWRCMTAWEYGEEGNRKHLHIVAYIPEGEIPGEFVLKRDYSTKRHKWEIRTENTFFAETFGRNDFSAITSEKERKGAVNYILKYITKDDAYIRYSRGIPEYLEMIINTETDILCTFYHNCAKKAVLFDSVFYTEENRDEIKAFEGEGIFELNAGLPPEPVII